MVNRPAAPAGSGAAARARAAAASAASAAAARAGAPTPTAQEWAKSRATAMAAAASARAAATRAAAFSALARSGYLAATRASALARKTAPARTRKPETSSALRAFRTSRTISGATRNAVRAAIAAAPAGLCPCSETSIGSWSSLPGVVSERRSARRRGEREKLRPTVSVFDIRISEQRRRNRTGRQERGSRERDGPLYQMKDDTRWRESDKTPSGGLGSGPSPSRRRREGRISRVAPGAAGRLRVAGPADGFSGISGRPRRGGRRADDLPNEDAAGICSPQSAGERMARGECSGRRAGVRRSIGRCKARS